jgi:hypothetical protein
MGVMRLHKPAAGCAISTTWRDAAAHITENRPPATKSCVEQLQHPACELLRDLHLPINADLAAFACLMVKNVVSQLLGSHP